MNTALAEVLRNQVKDLPFVDRIAGMVRPVIKIDSDGNGAKVRKVFPVACDVTEADCNSNSRWTDLVPSTQYKSIIYFEDGGSRLQNKQAGGYNFRSSIKLVCWLNQKKLGYTDCSVSSQAVLSIIKVLPFGYWNSEPFTRAIIVDIQELEKSSVIFGRYTYSEETNQYLMFPYDYFCIQIVTEFHVTKACIESMPLLTPKPCL